MGVLGDGGHASQLGGVSMYKTHGAGAGYLGGVCGSSNPVNDVGVTGLALAVSSDWPVFGESCSERWITFRIRVVVSLVIHPLQVMLVSLA